jgi:hypothetical protein
LPRDIDCKLPLDYPLSLERDVHAERAWKLLRELLFPSAEISQVGCAVGFHFLIPLLTALQSTLLDAPVPSGNGIFAPPPAKRHLD